MTKIPQDGVPASLLRRVGAYLIDSLFLSLVSWWVAFPILGAIYAWERTQVPLPPPGLSEWLGTQDALWVELLNFAVYVPVAGLLTAEWLYRWGNSPGKWLFRFWVVQVGSGTPLTRKQAWLRTLALAASYGTLGIGFLVAVFHPRRQALHDLLAKSWCVQRRRG